MVPRLQHNQNFINIPGKLHTWVEALRTKNSQILLADKFPEPISLPWHQFLNLIQCLFEFKRDLQTPKFFMEILHNLCDSSTRRNTSMNLILAGSDLNFSWTGLMLLFCKTRKTQPTFSALQDWYFMRTPCHINYTYIVPLFPYDLCEKVYAFYTHDF